MDEELVETDVPSVGERLRAAREEKGLNLEDIAAQTRIPRRHLEAIEAADWDRLPAPTYTIGFARSYATVVGLDRAEVADQLRSEMGGQRASMLTAEVFEPADPARTMPKSLVIGAILAVIVLVLAMSWLSRRSLDQPDETAANTAAAAPATQPAAAPPPAQTPVQQPVTLAATDAVWLQVYEKGGQIFFSGMLQPGQTYSVPPTAAAPLLKTGKPEALRVTVGNTAVPPVGPPATTVADVSLLPADLLKAGQAAAPAPQAGVSPPPPMNAAPSRRPRTTAPPAPAPEQAPTPAQPQPAATNTGVST